MESNSNGQPIVFVVCDPTPMAAFSTEVEANRYRDGVNIAREALIADDTQAWKASSMFAFVTSTTFDIRADNTSVGVREWAVLHELTQETEDFTTGPEEWCRKMVKDNPTDMSLWSRAYGYSAWRVHE